MASELRVNTLKDASGNNSVATSVVASGSAKAWLNLNGTGTIAARDSYNIASTTDVGTGQYTPSFTTSFGNANYVFQYSTVRISSGSYGLLPLIDVAITQATGSCRAEIQGSVVATYYEDPSVYCMSYDGDLA